MSPYCNVGGNRAPGHCGLCLCMLCCSRRYGGVPRGQWRELTACCCVCDRCSAAFVLSALADVVFWILGEDVCDVR